MDSLADRWTQLEPHTTVIGPDDDRRRPAVILFHGCGGLRDHLPKYAAAAKAAGWRAFIVDSYAPRGWSRQFAMAMVCTGILLHGSQRAGDVLAALYGVSQRSDVDASKVVLAGWSHGGWGIMEAMSSDRTAGMLGVADPGAVPLEGVVGPGWPIPMWVSAPSTGCGRGGIVRRPWR